MNTTNALPDPSPGNLWLVTGPSPAVNLLLDLGARLACRGGVRFLDGGNRFNAYRFSRTLGHNLEALSTPPEERPRLTSVLARVHLARAFTCYQVQTLLAETPASPVPTLVLDLLSTFYDENVPLREARRLLDACLAHLRRLSGKAPVAVSASLPRRCPEDRVLLLEHLQESTQEVWAFEPVMPVEPQRNFFELVEC